jgi:glycosyltransferase involved in cell wall biosynthesis
MKAAVELLAYGRSGAFVVLSTAFRDQLVDRYRVREDRIHVIPPGVDSGRFTPGPGVAAARAAMNLPGDETIFFAARRLSPRMGLDVLVDAWPAVWKELDGKCRLIIAGDGPERAQLRARIAATAGGHAISLLGRIPDEDMVGYLQAAGCALVPSTALEGFGLVVLEANACGTPVIASRVGGLPEAVGPLGEDLLVEPADVAGLGARMCAVARGHRPSRDECRKYAETFDWHAVADRHLALYRTL